MDSQDIAQETPAADVFIAPSIHTQRILSGASYTHHSPIPAVISNEMSTECVLGVDEAGRGPVLGPMVYSVFYLPLASHRSLLAETHHFDDSKVLTPAVRSNLMQLLCKPESDLHQSCGWATRVMSARDISAGMLKPTGAYNLNAQAMDATIELIKEVFAKGVNVKEIYIDTIGSPQTYQKKLERIFPTTQITVAKKADSLYPCVSAASVCAKVTRDAALDVCYEAYKNESASDDAPDVAAEGWGSGYPSDARCASWLKTNMDPVFGWGVECRFSWGTAKDLIEGKGTGVKVDWPLEEDAETMRVTDFFSATSKPDESEADELATWFGSRVTEEVF
ncbi:hypothetical protein L228DRAFT_213294 [Xylona heveae TC161]|uniref:Ribonuclease n=1 Tax=Xylona heveae (strain CBS 132557 / TC161) TaxID=1328760 RepID=A0A165F8P5_XYLHT|nr:hypothetical protein L228DRAFT_213294 [Xylona heveae TC161]KZF20709.1 hypothetical protein L228DRAFT_213294 [Xylona heveae TC161]